MNLVRAGMRQVRVPGAYDKVYKDECGFSFDTPFSPGGLYVNLVTMQGFGAAFVALDHQKSANALYLLQQYTKVPVPKEEHAEDGPTRMAIGMEGGFQVEDKFTVEKAHSLVLFPSRATILYPCAHLPELVIQAVRLSSHGSKCSSSHRVTYGNFKGSLANRELLSLARIHQSTLTRTSLTALHLLCQSTLKFIGLEYIYRAVVQPAFVRIRGVEGLPFTPSSCPFSTFRGS
jgi:hypothetical protein